MNKPQLINKDELAANCIGKDVVNSWGLFHVVEASVIPSNKIEIRCSVVSHKLCADNLVKGTQAMGLRVFILSVQEAKRLAAKPKIAVTVDKPLPMFDVNDEIAF